MQTFYNALTVINFILVAYFVYCMVAGNREEQREKEFDLGWGELKKEVRSERKKAAKEVSNKATVVRGAKATKAKATRKGRPLGSKNKPKFYGKGEIEKAFGSKAEKESGRDVLTIHKIQRRKKTK